MWPNTYSSFWSGPLYSELGDFSLFSYQNRKFARKSDKTSVNYFLAQIEKLPFVKNLLTYRWVFFEWKLEIFKIRWNQQNQEWLIFVKRFSQNYEFFFKHFFEVETIEFFSRLSFDTMKRRRDCGRSRVIWIAFISTSTDKLSSGKLLLRIIFFLVIFTLN